MTPRTWFAVTEGQQSGPYSDAQIQDLIAQGRVVRDSMVWCEGMTNWLKAADVPGLIPSSHMPPPVPAISEIKDASPPEPIVASTEPPPSNIEVTGIDLGGDTCLGAAEVLTPGVFGTPSGKMVNDVILFTDKRILICSRASLGKLVAASAVGSVAQTVGLGHTAALFVAGATFGALKHSSSVRVKVHKVKHAFDLKNITQLTEDEGRMRTFNLRFSDGSVFAFWIGKTIAWTKSYIALLQEHNVAITPSKRSDSRLRYALEAANGQTAG